MFSLIFSLSLLWLILSLSVVSFTYRKSNAIDSLDLTIAIAILFVLAGGIAYLRTDKWIYSSVWFVFSILGPIICFTNWQKSRKFRFKVSDSFICFGFVFLILYIMVAVQQGAVPEQKIFINPDPTGYGLVSGATIFHSNFPNLLSVFQNYTGVPFDFNYNWDTQIFPLIDNPWHIPNALDKYGIANGLYLHNGASFLAIPFIIFSNFPLATFAEYWFLITLIGISLVISNIHQIVLNELSTKQELSIRHRILIASAILMLCSGVYWIIPFLLEGFANQVVSFAFTLGAYSIVREVYSYDKKKQSIRKITFTLIILTISTFFVYAQQLPFIFYAAFAAAFVTFIAPDINNIIRSLKTFRSLSIVTVIMILSWATLTSRGVQEAIRAFTNSAGGGAVHLGVNSPLDAIGLSNKNTLLIEPKFLDDTKLLIEREAIPWTNSIIDGYQWEIPQQGYILTLNTPQTIFWQLLAVSILILMTIIIGKRSLFGLVALAAPIPVLLFFYLRARTGQGIVEKINSCSVTLDCFPKFSDYVWMRLLTLLTIFTVPLVASSAAYAMIKIDSKVFRNANWKPRKSLRKDKKLPILYLTLSKILPLLLILIIFQNGKNINQDISNLSSNSRVAYFSAGCPDWLNDEKNIIVSDDLLISLSLGVCAKKFKMLSDSFPISWKVDGEEYDVIHITWKNEVWKYAMIGKLQVLSDFKSPCDVDCVRNLPGFKQNLNAMYRAVN